MKQKFQQRRLEFYKEAYDRELARRSEGMDRLSNTITIFTIIGGVIAFYCSDMPEHGGSIAGICFYYLLVCGGIFASIGFVQLSWMIYKGTQYHVLESSSKYDNAMSGPAATQPNTDQGDENCVFSFNYFILNQYRDFSSYNQDANDLREKRYNEILKAAVCSAALLILASVPYLLIREQKEEKPVKVIITSPLKIMPDETPSTPQPTASQQTPAPSNTALPPVNFELPPPRVINESFAAEINPRTLSSNSPTDE